MPSHIILHEIKLARFAPFIIILWPRFRGQKNKQGDAMSEEKWVAIAEIPGRLRAELLRGLLEAQEIQVYLSQEGAGAVYGLTIGTLGTVQVLVPAADYERAVQVLEEYYASLEANSEEAAGDTGEQADG
jgi:hypothetical protein